LKASKIIFDYYKKKWPRYTFGILMVLLSTFLGATVPGLLGRAIDELNLKNIDIQAVQYLGLLIGIVSVLAFLTRFFWRYLILGFTRRLEFHLRENLFSHLQKLSADYYNKNNTGDIITRAIVDVQAVRMMMGFATVSMLDAVVTTVMSVFNMTASISLPLTLLAITPIPFLILIIVKVRVLVRTRYAKVQEAVSNISSKVQENITGIRVIKAFSQESAEAEAFSQLSKNKVEAEIKLARAFSLINPSVRITFGIVFSVFLVIGGMMVAQKTITLGELVAFNTYLLLLMGPIGNIGRIVDRWQRGSISMKRLDHVFMEHPTIDDSKADMSITKLETGEITAKNLKFNYEPAIEDDSYTVSESDSCPLINDISFHVPSGSSIAIMGPTGCGKSTIASILTRVWGCEDGMLFIDGKDINTIPLKVLRRSCAYVPQESFLFSDTILENIRFFDKTVSDEEVYEAAAAANVHEDISGFPEGYETMVGERGMTLSGGQKQRIALARALVRKPKILILDDCMSALDINTENRIIENLKSKISDCTAVIVTHRPSAAQLADTILFLGDEEENRGDENE